MEIIDIRDSIVSEQIKASIDKIVNAYCDELIKQDKEIERLNNIINELEDIIYGKYHYFEDKLFKDAGERLLEKTYKGILDKLKELKEKQ